MLNLPTYLSLAQTRTCKSKKKGTEEITKLTFKHLENFKLPNKGREWRGGTKHTVTISTILNYTISAVSMPIRIGH